jgi:hypothetical protein
MTRLTYPSTCLPQHCMRLECSRCPNAAHLERWRAWQARTGARQPDPVHDGARFEAKEMRP